MITRAPINFRGLGLDIVATMPPLPASACAATQTYIPPGGTFTSGPSAGLVTSTGACQDGTAAVTSGPSTVCFHPLNLLPFSTVAGSAPLDTSQCVGPFSLMTWGVVALGALLLFSGGSGGGGRRMNPGRHYGRPFHGRNAKYRDKEYKRLKKEAKREKKAQRG